MKSNESKYRYDRVTMGILMSDFSFSKGSAAPGDLFPIFNIASTEGEMIAKEHFLGKRPLLVVFGSATCPMTASSIESLKRLHARYGDRVTFITLNVREAHPAENVSQPRTYEQKVEHARRLKQQFEIPWIVASDDLDGTLHRALDTKPNAAYLMDINGRLVFRSLWAGDAHALGSALQSLVDEQPLATSESTYTVGPLVRGLGFFHDVLQQAGPQAMRDMLLAAPPIAILGRIAGVFRSVTPERRALPAFFVLFGIISAFAGTVAAVLA